MVACILVSILILVLVSLVGMVRLKKNRKVTERGIYAGRLFDGGKFFSEYLFGDR